MGALHRPETILLVEDDPGDVLMITEALEGAAGPRDLHVVGDGVEAMSFLHHATGHESAPRPDVILLDLNMPRMDGRQTLAAIKGDVHLRAIPVVVFTTSSAQADIANSYDHHANAYVTKPLDLTELFTVVQHIDEFFISIAARVPDGTRRAV